MRRFLLIFLFTTLCSITLKAQHSDALIKAVFFERFSRFIDWPSEAPKEFKIAIIGNDRAMETELKRVYARQKIQNKPVKIIHLDSIEQITPKNCQILFIAKNMDKQSDLIFKQTRNLPILTIGDHKNLEKKGVIINFYLRGESVHFKINEQQAKKSSFYISYHLLQIAEVIHD